MSANREKLDRIFPDQNEDNVINVPKLEIFKYDTNIGCSTSCDLRVELTCASDVSQLH